MFMLRKNDLATAFNYYKRSEALAREVDSKTDLKEVYELMSANYQ